MSKNKAKDKKNDASSLIQRQYETQKRELIDLHFTLKKLEERLASKTIENEELFGQLQQLRQLNEEKIKILMERGEDDEKRLNSQINRITELEINATRYQSQITSLKEELALEKQQKIKEISDLKIKIDSERMKLDIQLKDLQVYAQNRDRNESEMMDLKQIIEHERADKIRQLADKQREKVQATDKLREEMQKKIREMTENLKSLKKDDLSTTTRLTILQNHQLTSELEYQSKQTEKLIFKEEEMSHQIKKLTQQVAIHQEVEEELAKRAHFSKGIIKKLNDKIQELERELKQVKQNRESIKTANLTIKQRSSYNTSENQSKILPDQASREFSKKTIALEVQSQLQKTEKKYVELCSKFQAERKEKASLMDQLKKYESSSNEVIKMLFVYLTKVLNSLEGDNKENLESDQIVRLNLDSLRMKQVEDWTVQEVDLIVKMIINLLRPFLTKKNLITPTIRKLLVIEDSKDLVSSKSEAKSFPRLLGEKCCVTGLKNLPVNIASKIVGSNLREWGTTLRANSSDKAVCSLKRRYKISQSRR